MMNWFILFSSILLLSCSGIDENPSLERIPTLILREGEVRGFDLAKYKKDSSINISMVESRDLNLRLVSGSDSLYIESTPKTPSLTKIHCIANDIPHDILVVTKPLVKHTFTFLPESSSQLVVVMGGFNDWSRTALPLHDADGDGILERIVYLKPERHEYKFVVDGQELIDPDNPIFISNNIGGWNSILDLSSHKKPPGGQWIKSSTNGPRLYFNFVYPSDGALPIDVFVLFNNRVLHNDDFDPKPDGSLMVNISKCENGLLRITGIDTEGRAITENHTIIKNGKPLHPSDLPHDWHFAVLYNLMVDRFLDGNHGNTQRADAENLHPLANFHGGDFAGIIQKLEEGYFSDLGITSIWLSPVQLQPERAYTEWIPPNRKFTGYHGYWPIAPRTIDPRYGTDTELKTLVNLAHQKGIKVILDFVSNHVHQEHPYVSEHRDWFGKVKMDDGSMNIRNWSEETRLTTWFDEFIPSFDYLSAPEAIDQVVNDACWWLDTYNLDGFRQDAVKHVPHSFWKKLTSQMKICFPEKHVYQIGETFGSDELILDYVNPAELDAQFNFGIYFNARGPFASEEADFSFLSNVMIENFKTYQPVNLMGNITSNHDQLRFIGLADGQVSFSDNGTERTFSDPPKPVIHISSYDKLVAFHAFNISIPGIPVVYYGEEIGLMGSGDPGNRRPMRFNEKTTKHERKLHKRFSEINKLRAMYPSLALGDFRLLTVDKSIMVYEKIYFDEIVLVAFNHSAKQQTVSFKNSSSVTKWVGINNQYNTTVDDSLTMLGLPPYSYGFFKGTR